MSAVPLAEATAPPERRGIARDAVRLLVGRPGGVEHAIFRDLPRLLAPGDLLVVNTSATLPAALDAVGITNQRETTLVWNRATGVPIHNAIVWQDRRAEPTCAALREQGHEVYNPADWETYGRSGGLPWRKFDLTEAFVEYCTYIVREADAVVHLPGWERSPGATAEVSLALAVGKPTLALDRFPMTG